jgi:uncharacterized protein YndB with AHSA1/START domain
VTGGGYFDRLCTPTRTCTAGGQVIDRDPQRRSLKYLPVTGLQINNQTKESYSNFDCWCSGLRMTATSIANTNNSKNVFMSTDLVISKSIDIFSAASKVWEVLIKPEMIAQYFTGAETVTTWQVGSEITFAHIYEGKEFINKGVILNFEPNKLLRYTYWTAFSNTEDKPENYTTITYDLTEINDKTQLRLTQTNFKNAEWYKALEIGWDQVLEKMKELAEGNDYR